MHCPFSTALTRISPLHSHLSCYWCVACSLLLRRVSLLFRAIVPASCVLPLFYLSDMHISISQLSFLLMVYCPVSTSLNHIYPLHRHLSCYRCAASSLLVRRASLLFTAILLATGVLPLHYLFDVYFCFPPLSVRLKVHCLLSTSPIGICPFHRYLQSYGYLAPTEPLLCASPLSTAGFLPNSHMTLFEEKPPFPTLPTLEDVHLRLYILCVSHLTR